MSPTSFSGISNTTVSASSVVSALSAIPNALVAAVTPSSGSYDPTISITNVTTTAFSNRKAYFTSVGNVCTVHFEGIAEATLPTTGGGISSLPSLSVEVSLPPGINASSGFANAKIIWRSDVQRASFITAYAPIESWYSLKSTLIGNNKFEIKVNGPLVTSTAISKFHLYGKIIYKVL